MHKEGCTYSRGILYPECPECIVLIEHPERLNERFQYYKDQIESKCKYCDKEVTLKINGLYPHGISLVCECF